MNDWMPVPNFEGLYWIDKQGNIKNKNGKYLKKQDNNGVEFVELQGNGQKTRVRISQILVEVYEGGKTMKNTKHNWSNPKLAELLAIAKHDTHRNYTVYNEYRQKIAQMELTPQEFTDAIIELARVLEV